MSEIVMIPAERLHPHEFNPRKDVGDVSELAESIRSVGIMQNLTVIPMPDSKEKFGAQHYTILAGHRRFAAAKEAGLAELPCVIVDLSPVEQIGVMMTENMQRSQLTPMEQAFGFQTMINLGDSLDGIQEKTGVRKRRVRTALVASDLDKGKLTAAESRCGQISFAMLEKLEKIENKEERNKVLDTVGTYNFDWTYRRALLKQETDKVLPEIRKVLRDLGAKKISQSDAYNAKYRELGEKIVLTRWAEEKEKLQAVSGKKELFYVLNTESDYLRFYGLDKKAREKRSPEEIAKEKAVQETWEELEKLNRIAYETRFAFVRELPVTRENREIIVEWFVSVAMKKLFDYGRDNEEAAMEALGMEKGSFSWETKLQVAEAILAQRGEKAWPVIAWAAMGDREDNRYYSGWRGEFPKYARSEATERIYGWLEKLGYVPSDEETQLRDGTHELLHRGDKDNG